MNTEAHGAAAPARATRREWAGLALLVLPMLVLSIDLTVLFFAMPRLSLDLQPTASESLWIVHVYGFLIAGFLVTMGRLGDRFGPRRLMMIGSVAFAVLSVVAAFSTSATMLIIARAALGVAGATLMPSLFSLLRSMFRDDTQRRFAIAILFSTFSVGGAVGPLLGGALLEVFWWGSVFLINVPPMVALVIAGPKLLPERREGDSARIDLASVALSVTGMLAVVYGLQELTAGQEAGDGDVWPYVAVVAAGLVVLVFFARRQRRLSHPLFDLALLTDRRMAVALGTLLVTGIGVAGIFYLFTQYLQWVAALSPLEAGLWTLPYIGLNILGAMVAPPVSARIRPAIVMVAGLAVAAVGAAGFAVLSGDGVALWLLVAAISVIGLGQGAAVGLMSDLIISHAPADKTGSAAAAQEVGGELGTAAGIAVGGAVGVVAYREALADTMPADLPEPVTAAARSSVHEGVTAADALDRDAPALLDAVHGAVGHGLGTYAGIGAVLLVLAAGAVAAVLVRGSEGTG
ncbi:DHA2 family multidrug resistance protein-like MFS transporter [Stackebrandtia albiflava]|uniref:DHA2 family multidrug resistance protein-like MFS transporter n=1 Tax=Stackebrandtia albiflava TaxID=406432 RepID=A0A562VC56_9ACTN|nr:MFS transporter [Stackebrandtia albiflava]TWJ15464.1 DHA2 family multidrug resistance protein-like MFS transporter [Stackebrandtia albiflava]